MFSNKLYEIIIVLRFNHLSNKIKNLKKSKSKFLVPKFIVFDVSTFQKDAEIIFNEVKKQFGKNKVAIRSSSVQEDNNFSNAGKFHSELNVKIEKKIFF